ncbi:hypothetical protein F4803DRAFT_501734 [Xylaria telfairii]|nr:hypothetical protein F4803DRAFT_501734 [Xylaria telfairii]
MENTDAAPEPAAAAAEVVTEVLADSAPAEETTSEEVPIDEVPAQGGVVEQPAAEEPASDDTPTQEAPAEDESAKEAPAPAPTEETIKAEPVAEPVVEPVVEEAAVEESPAQDASAIEPTAAEVAAEEAPTSAPASEETPAAEEAPVVLEEPPVIEEPPVVEKIPAVEEAPIVEEAPVAEEVPVAKQAPDIVEPAPAEETAAAEEAPATEEVPATEEDLAVEEPSAAEVIPAVEDAPIEEATTIREAPIVEEAPASAEAPPAEEHAPIAEETLVAEDTPITEEAPAVEEVPVAKEAPVEEHPVAEVTPVVEEGPAVEAPGAESAIVERELPATEAVAVDEMKESVSREMPPVAAEPDAPKPQPDAAEKPKVEVRDEKSREAEEGRNATSRIRGEEKSRRRSRGKKEPLPCFFEDTLGVKANDLGEDEPELAPENILGEDVFKSSGEVGEDTVTERDALEVPQAEALAPGFSCQKLGVQLANAAIQEEYLGNHFPNDLDSTTRTTLVGHTERNTSSDAHSGTWDAAQHPNIKGPSISDEHDLHTSIIASELREHMDEPPDITVRALADKKPDTVSTFQTELPANEESYATTNILEPAKEYVAKRDHSFSWDSAVGNEPFALEERNTVENLHSIEDCDLMAGLDFTSHVIGKMGSFTLEDLATRSEFVAHGMNIEQPSPQAIPQVNLEPVAFHTGVIVDSLPEDSAMSTKRLATEHPLLSYEPYHAQGKLDEPTRDYRSPKITENWPFATIDVGYAPMASQRGELPSEDSAWETVDEDEIIEPRWGDVETIKGKPSSSATSKVTHELSEDSGDKNIGRETLRETITETHLHYLPGSTSVHMEQTDLQSPGVEILHDVLRSKDTELPHQPPSPHQFTPNEIPDDKALPHNEGQTQEVVPTKPIDGEMIERGQSPDATNINESQCQIVLEDPTTWGKPGAETLTGSGSTTLPHPQYFDTIAEDSDDEFVVKKSGAVGSVDGSKQIDSSTHDDSVSREILVEKSPVAAGASDEAQAGVSTRSREQTVILETFPAAENEPRGWSSALEEEDDDTDIETHQLPHVFDYARFISEVPTARPSRVAGEVYSGEEPEGLAARTESWRRNISHSGRTFSIARGDSETSQRVLRNDFNWAPSSSSSIGKSDQGRFEPLLDDEHLGTIDVAFIPSQTLGAAQTEDQALEDAGISDFELESTSPSETHDLSFGFHLYAPHYDQRDEVGSVLDVPIGSKQQRNDAQADLYSEPPAIPIGGALHTHDITPRGDIDISPPLQQIRGSSSYDSSRDSEVLEELPVVPRLPIGHAGFEFNRQRLLARVRAPTEEDHGDQTSELSSIPSTSFEYANPIRFNVDRVEDISPFEKRAIPPKSIRRIRRPIQVHSSTQTDEGLPRGSSRGSNYIPKNLRSGTPAIVLPDLSDRHIKALGRAKSLQTNRQQRFQEAEETVATAVVIYATAQELSSPSSPSRGDDQINHNIIETFGATQGPVQVSSDSVSSGIATEYSDDESDLSPTVADLSTDDEGRDRHHRHRPHRSHRHSSRSKERRSGEEHRHHHHRRHRSKDDSKLSPKTSAERLSSRHKREESRRYDSGHERSHDSSHRRHRTPEEQAAHDKRKAERRARRELERENERGNEKGNERGNEREREREHKGKEAETTPPPDDRNSPRSSRRSGPSRSERRVSIKEEPSPVTTKRFFDFSRGESTLAAASVSSKPESHRAEAPKRSSPPTSTSKSHSSRPHRESSDAPRPRSSRHRDETREDSSRRHRERSSRPKVDDELKASSRSMAETEGKHSTRSRADSDARTSTRSKGDSDGRPSSSSHAKPRSSDTKEDRHGHSSRRAERQRERDAERKKKEAPTSGLKSVFKKLFA